ncbi:Mitochondrial inner membrane organizing system component [Blastomyces dermatitidis]|uniref:MICOS complex subunit MIC10 n=3 Tax=Blastomyces TaxID=229219 RepID=A0A179UI46_BLAGS|nr:DUF543 domain-containing protein [Blastomyces gilchristii SLH14081]XP_045274429.1 uncharacterized protein BDCG_02134 [Blastomyces dermatitidis ER-3]EGE79809.1 DUF543 domain-containing protein [Blastomyces dermatitidis ATCC 18188]EQL33275.1 hypothetical protein BDFG_04709 [Blastomyces dermatitidis ATCC 26199]EEQ87014.1 hypothetical protein BDCG_02134 [Blastomyces dermatitidis ER-3]OAT07725.1 DUF543 domain-containing protein [Blastomyces gilchristii SLH14081]
MTDSKETGSVVPRSTKPLSEALLNDKWDRAISSMIIRSSLGLSFGVIFSVLLFKRRAWPAWVGLGFGAGRAWEEADASFRRGDQPLYNTNAFRQSRS